MVSAKASVMVYNDVEKKWLPSGSSSGISKVCIYHHPGNNTFRVVGRKLQDMEVSDGMWSIYIRVFLPHPGNRWRLIVLGCMNFFVCFCVILQENGYSHALQTTTSLHHSLKDRKNGIHR